MHKIKIFIAEDTKESRDILVDQLKEYSEKKFKDVDIFEINTADSYQKALNIINNIERNSDYYDIFFCDIDFTEDNKGGGIILVMN
jgi:CheY-like chemotaxis protein